MGLAGIAAVVGGGALSDAGASAAIQPVAKMLNCEHMIGEDYVKDLAVGSIIGGFTGLIGWAGAGASLGDRTIVGAVSRATSIIIEDGTIEPTAS